MDDLQTKKVQEGLMQIFAEIPFNRMLGLSFDVLEEDRMIMSFDMKNELIGNFLHGILHGGVISSVLDMAGGAAAIIASVKKLAEQDFEVLKATLGKSSTIDLHVNYIRPGKGEKFIAQAWVLNSGRRICFTRMELHNEAGTLIATAAGTYSIS